MPPRGPQQDITSEFATNVPYLLGQIQGQLRELIHSSNNNGQQLVALSERVGALEKANERREGAAGIASMIIKSPLVVWLIGLIVSGWALLTGRVHL